MLQKMRVITEVRARCVQDHKWQYSTE